HHVSCHHLCLFLFIANAEHRDLHSFPTRRSSDLTSSVGRSTFHVTSLRAARMPSGIPITAQNSTEVTIIASVVMVWDQRPIMSRSEEHTSELQSRENLVCRLLLEKKNKNRSLCQQ